ncbi:uncharacterized protein N7496_009433 [Penicillium cataractarum]|uniref:MYND-type domain-containing protein n=1 Tax=Penicillium cataractarum TaxID=2100454 RepID=A0A9W9RQC5_9EURO|nr:uncharacterized protein N7496_009433 [Penicillium cataractarum]KAJ5363720.1 hypothetical protein N7496_009433 [Penicillium cataractarum]
MPAEPCSVTACTNPGTLTCSICDQPKTRYCSAACQKQDWTTHKRTCAGAQKHNCFIIRTTAPNGSTNPADRIEPFPLSAYGNWIVEMKELQQRLGWPHADEAGKFYSHQAKDNHWYYYMYASSAPGLPVNDIATRCRHHAREVRGDVAVVRSGPEGFASYEETFCRMELLKTVNYYNTANSSEVFGQRERSRFGERSGFPPGFLDAHGLTTMHFS